MNGFQTLTGTPPAIIFPPYLTVGDTWCFNMAAGDYGVSPWTAILTFASGTIRVTNTATLQNGVFYWAVPATDTTKLPAPGSVAYSVVVNNPTSAENYTLQSGIVQLAPDLSNTSITVPTQTSLQQQLAACQATILQLLSQRTSSVVFSGKAYTLWDLSKLYEIEKDLLMQVAAEQTRLSGNSRSRIIIPVFKNPWGGPYPSAPWYPYGW
jgi:hypothetical protein